MMRSTSGNERSMRYKTFLKLSVLVASQLFSLFIILFGGMWIGWSCKESYDICEDRSFLWIVGSLVTTVIFHLYLAFRVGRSRKRLGHSPRTWKQQE